MLLCLVHFASSNINCFLCLRRTYFCVLRHHCIAKLFDQTSVFSHICAHCMRHEEWKEGKVSLATIRYFQVTPGYFAFFNSPFRGQRWEVSITGCSEIRGLQLPFSRSTSLIDVGCGHCGRQKKRAPLWGRIPRGGPIMAFGFRAHRKETFTFNLTFHQASPYLVSPEANLLASHLIVSRAGNVFSSLLEPPCSISSFG